MPKLRPEARPASWSELDTQQRAAFKDVMQMISEAVDETGSSAAVDPESWISRNRSSRTVLLSGERGTGKTTLLLSIMDATRPKSVDASARIDDLELMDIVNHVRFRVVWLEPMDMEAMQPAANLLEAILARIDDAVRRFGAAGQDDEEREEHEPKSLLYAGSSYHEALLDLQRLQTDSALAWYSNLPAREGHLDPDAYAVEIMRNERASLSINSKLDAALDALAKQAFRGTGIRAPLFLLPVDDMDLNPLACLDLLKLLRMISVRRLFTVLLGDLRVAELVLNLKLSNDLGGLLRNLRFAELLAVRAATVGVLAGDIAANALRKLLPPSQRIVLSAMSISEGVNFRPLGHDAADPRVHELLLRCPMPGLDRFNTLLATAPPEQPYLHSLRDFLLVTRPNLTATARADMPKDGQLERSYLDSCDYTGVQIFQSAPRRLADLWLELQRIDQTLQAQRAAAASPSVTDGSQAPVTGSPSTTTIPGSLDQASNQSWRRTVDTFARLCLSSLSGEAALTPQERETVTTSIVLNPRDEWELGRLPLHVYDQVVHRPSFEVTPPPSSPAASSDVLPNLRLYLAEHKGWRFQVADLLQGEQEALYQARQPGSVPSTSVPALRDDLPQRTLARNTAAELVVFHDMLALGPDAQRFFSPLLPEMPLVGAGWVTAEWSLGDSSALLPWLAPRFRSFWEYDLFLGAWNEILQQSLYANTSDSYLILQHAFFGWISAGTKVVTDQPIVSLPSVFQPIDWKPLMTQLNTVALTVNPMSEIGQHSSDWLIRVALMLMPESGVPVEANTAAVGAAATSQALLNLWKNQSQSIKRLRAIRLGELVRGNLAAIAGGLMAPPALGQGGIFDPELGPRAGARAAASPNASASQTQSG